MGNGGFGVTATSKPSGRRSSASGGLVQSGSWGIGLIPSPAASAPVSTASTPGSAAAREVSIAWIRAWAWGERTTKARAAP